jgi:hypothetical protein
VPKSALKITSGGEPSKYSYKGDSGEFSSIIIDTCPPNRNCFLRG